MTDIEDGDIPEDARPSQQDVGFSLEPVLDAVVSLRAEIPEDAFTAEPLGTERFGSGVVIDDNGLIVTIGYLITEADKVWLTTNKGQAAPAHVVGYDQVTGLGLVQALSRLDVAPLSIASAKGVQVGSPMIVAGAGGISQALMVRLAAKREFAGYWEYLLDEALFTLPAHPRWSGTAMLDETGKLVGIGSLLVQTTAASGATQAGNMFVPADLLPPVRDDLLRFGKVRRQPRPWLGFYPTETDEGVAIAATAARGPAAKSGIDAGDVIVAVAGMEVEDLADLYRKMWKLGPAGTEVPLTLLRDGRAHEITVVSADRDTFLKRPSLH
ncbi:MAG: S1C family serine protease [Pseudomonadota bacterium]